MNHRYYGLLATSRCQPAECGPPAFWPRDRRRAQPGSQIPRPPARGLFSSALTPTPFAYLGGSGPGPPRTASRLNIGPDHYARLAAVGSLIKLMTAGRPVPK